MKILIIGGGIAGLSAAIALRNCDHEIIVLEQSSLNREIGATISLQPNASKIVEQTWGMHELLEPIAMVDEAFRVFNLDGEEQIRIPLNTGPKYGAERLVFHRVDLHEALKKRATSTDFPSRPAQIVTAKRVIDCDCDTGSIRLHDGSEMHGDLIIAADGIKSKLRKSVLGKSVSALKTGHSAYRMVIPTGELIESPEFCSIIDPRQPVTTMVMGHDKRLIMGPARKGTIYSIVAMVPDESMNEPSDDSSWTTSGSLDKMLQTFENFPIWAKVPLSKAKEAGLWQLRDIDKLDTWCRGRTILIGDAAHAMLPTQGQGASQSIEDAEALGAFFADISDNPSLQDITRRNQAVFECRYERASIIQEYSRQFAKPATDPGANKIKMSPAQFMDYNCNYAGAVDWLGKMQKSRSFQKEDNGLQSITNGVSRVSVSA